jgi:hypothetical protein
VTCSVNILTRRVARDPVPPATRLQASEIAALVVSAGFSIQRGRADDIAAGLLQGSSQQSGRRECLSARETAGPKAGGALVPGVAGTYQSPRHLQGWISRTLQALFRDHPWVEVAGIEPASFSFSAGLLRAQPVEGFGPVVVTGVGERS